VDCRISSLTEAGSGVILPLVGSGTVFGPQQIREMGRNRMRQVVNRADAACQASAERTPSPPIPHVRATDAWSRGIKSPISNGLIVGRWCLLLALLLTAGCQGERPESTGGAGRDVAPASAPAEGDRSESARDKRKRELLRQYAEAVRKEDFNRGIELLKELDKVITPQEGAALAKSAERLFKARLKHLTVIYLTHVTQESWTAAIAVSKTIINEFPNSHMAQEIRDRMPELTKRAAAHGLQRGGS